MKKKKKSFKQFNKQVGKDQNTNEENQSLSRGMKARCDGIHAMNDWGFEVDIEDTEHVNGVKNNT